MATSSSTDDINTGTTTWEAVLAGRRYLFSARWWQLLLLLPMVVVCFAMLPFGRTAPGDGGGLLAPATVDSGHLFRTRPGTDFFSVYDAGARALRGEDPYRVNRDTGGPGVRAPYVATYRYLPMTAYWLAAPLNVLPPWHAFTAWILFQWLLLFANFLLCVGRRPAYMLLFGLIWFVWFPAVAELHMGQFTLFMAALLLWGFDGFFAGARWGGLGWGLAVFLKVYPIVMAPSLYIWRQRTLVLTILGIALGTTLLWQLFVPSDMSEGLGARGIEGRLAVGMRQPYAGAQGTQELVNAVVWRVTGHSTGEALEEPLYFAHDPVFLINAGVLGIFAMICLWALIRTRHEPSLPAIGLFWLTWFYAYADCWEHHYVLFQAVLALLLARGVIHWPLGLFCWLCAGAPSLWWFWQKAGYSGNETAELLGLLYFIQRPLAVLALTGALVLRIAREK